MSFRVVFTLWFILMITLFNVFMSDFNFDDARSRTRPTRIRVQRLRRKD